MASALFKLAAVIVGLTLSALIFGWVCTTIWGWYFVKLMGAPKISYKLAIGASHLVSAFMIKTPSEKDSPELSPAMRIGSVIVAYLLVLLMAGFWYIVLP